MLVGEHQVARGDVAMDEILLLQIFERRRKLVNVLEQVVDVERLRVLDQVVSDAPQSAVLHHDQDRPALFYECETLFFKQASATCLQKTG